MCPPCREGGGRRGRTERGNRRRPPESLDVVTLRRGLIGDEAALRVKEGHVTAGSPPVLRADGGGDGFEGRGWGPLMVVVLVAGAQLRGWLRLTTANSRRGPLGRAFSP